VDCFTTVVNYFFCLPSSSTSLYFSLWLFSVIVVVADVFVCLFVFSSMQTPHLPLTPLLFPHAHTPQQQRHKKKAKEEVFHQLCETQTLTPTSDILLSCVSRFWSGFAVVVLFLAVSLVIAAAPTRFLHLRLCPFC
jgi:hypothetical protein